MAAISHPRTVRWMFDHYLRIAPPSFVGARPPARDGARVPVTVA